MSATEQLIRDSIGRSRERAEMWIDFLRAAGVRRMVEVGVYRGDFAAAVLKGCDAIEKYYMIDPWRHLSDWNKPRNMPDDVFEQFLADATSNTQFAAPRRAILRGRTIEVVDEIADAELDFAYIDGDHTLRGITIDLIRILPKVRPGGWIAGDDFTWTIWQHHKRFEPTLVFPFAVHFAEALGAPVYALPYRQFLIAKDPDQGFSFVDLVGRYADVGLRKHLRFRNVMRGRLATAFPHATRLAKRILARST